MTTLPLPYALYIFRFIIKLVSGLFQVNIDATVFCQEWQQLERDLLTVEVPVAVYFAYEDKELTEIYKDIETAVTSDQAGSAFEGT